MERLRLIRQEVERCRLIIERLGQQRQSPDELTSTEWSRTPALLESFLAEQLVTRLEIRWVPIPGQIAISRERLQQCLAILVKNAVEASPPDKRVKLRGEVDSGEAVFQVIDLGPGFARELKEQLGEPLVTTKSDRGGLGLGLYLVKTFVSDFNGSFSIQTGKDLETIVEMRLPVTVSRS